MTFTIRYLGNSLAPAGETNPLALMNGTFMSSITLDSNQLQPNTPLWRGDSRAGGAPFTVASSAKITLNFPGSRVAF